MERSRKFWETPRSIWREAARLLLAQLKLELDELPIRLEEAETLVEKTAQDSEVCRRLDAIPGIGPLTAMALIAAIGKAAAFRKGRGFAAWVGWPWCLTRPSASTLSTVTLSVAVQLKCAGSSANKFAELAIDAQGNRRRRIVTPADRERVARQPQIE